MEESPTGAYVLYADHIARVAELEGLLKTLRVTEDGLTDQQDFIVRQALNLTDHPLSDAARKAASR